MFKQNLVRVWVGILALSGMFLMGQDFWITPSSPRIVFVSTTSTDGSMIGLEAADDICQADASAAGLTGPYKAWLSDTTSSPDTRFDKGGDPYQLPGGQKVADDWADLTDGTIDHTINQFANGTAVTGGHVWTNTWEDGTAANTDGDSRIDSCDDWTSEVADYSGIYGEVTGLSWTHSGWESCSTHNRLYCFEQL